MVAVVAVVAGAEGAAVKEKRKREEKKKISSQLKNWKSSTLDEASKETGVENGGKSGPSKPKKQTNQKSMK